MGRHGPYAVAASRQISGSVTFSLEPTVWLESEWQEEGTVVFLSDLRLKRAGWRGKKGRFVRPSDEQSARSTQVTEVSKFQFLYPVSRQFPFDEVCEQIIRELEKRNWKVPGIEVDFHEYGRGAQRYSAVSHVTGIDFTLRFGRKQRRLPGDWNDTAAVTGINIPMEELHVYDDESGPTFYLYVGNNWEADRERFVNGSKVNSKLNGEPRTYLQYKGACRCTRGFGGYSDLDHTHPGKRPPLLVHDNDLGREYEPRKRRWDWKNWTWHPGDPKALSTSDVMEKFRAYLVDVVLPHILSCPVPEERIDIFLGPAMIPFPQNVGPLFCFCQYRDAERIKQGKEDSSQLELDDRYGMLGSGYRLVSLGDGDGNVPAIAYDGFLWCGIGEVTPETPIDSLEVPGHYRWSDRERFVVRVKPKTANGVFVADHSVYEDLQKAAFDALPQGRDRLTDSEASVFVSARGRTIVPIHEYSGGYRKPVVLINRELGFDEVEVVSGPHKDYWGY
ncbi:MAG: hypothetical protein HZC02_02865 [Candidatus Levybacteria bacterium]|nr:hypothetical protein [Candidatus Levybacteria bacterium]